MRILEKKLGITDTNTATETIKELEKLERMPEPEDDYSLVEHVLSSFIIFSRLLRLYRD
jgi:hypothetical protein